VAEHQVELGGGVAQGLRDAAVAVVAVEARGDGQGELLVEFDGLGLQGAAGRDGQGEKVLDAHGRALCCGC